MAYDLQGRAMAAMCVSLADYDNDGWVDLFISDFQGAGGHIWHNDRRGHMLEVPGAAGILVPTLNVLSFGGGFFDYDNDGWLDVFIANGHVYPEVDLLHTPCHLPAAEFPLPQSGERQVRRDLPGRGDCVAAPSGWTRRGFWRFRQRRLR